MGVEVEIDKDGFLAACAAYGKAMDETWPMQVRKIIEAYEAAKVNAGVRSPSDEDSGSGHREELRGSNPAPAPTHQPVELAARIWKRDSTQEWVLEITGTVDDVYMNCRHTEPLTTAKSDVPGLPSLYKAPEREIGKEQTLVKWIRTKERKPEPHHVVIVEGGLATWTGSEWLTKSGEDSGRVIQWDVLYWTPLITPPLTDAEDNRRRGTETGGAEGLSKR